MTLVPRTPQQIFNLLNDKDSFVTSIDRVFDELMNSTFPHFSSQMGGNVISKGAYPKCNVLDKVDSIIIEAAVPGLTKKDVNVSVEEGILTIKGNKVHDKADNSTTGYILRELKKSSFKRTFALGDNLDVDKIEAEFKDGILSIVLPKKEKEESKVKTIAIK